MAATPRKAARGVERLAAQLGGIERVVLLAGGDDRRRAPRAGGGRGAGARRAPGCAGRGWWRSARAAPRIVAELGDARVVADLEAAMTAAAALAQPGDGILLAPMFPLDDAGARAVQLAVDVGVGLVAGGGVTSQLDRAICSIAASRSAERASGAGHESWNAA